MESLLAAADSGILTTLANSDVDSIVIQVMRKPTKTQVVTASVISLLSMVLMIGAIIYLFRETTRNDRR